MSCSSSESGEWLLPLEPAPVVPDEAPAWDGSIAMCTIQQAVARLEALTLEDPVNFLLGGESGNCGPSHKILMRGCECRGPCTAACVAERTKDLVLAHRIEESGCAPLIADAFLTARRPGVVNVVYAVRNVLHWPLVYADPSDLVAAVVRSVFVLHHECGLTNNNIRSETVAVDQQTGRIVFTDWTFAEKMVLGDPWGGDGDKVDALRMCRDQFRRCGLLGHPLMAFADGSLTPALFDSFVG